MSQDSGTSAALKAPRMPGRYRRASWCPDEHEDAGDFACVAGTERDENPEAEQEQREDEVLRAWRKGVLPEMLCQFGDIERAGARLQVERDEPDQRDERPDAEVQRDLERGVVLLLAPAPDANHDEGRHQRQLMEEVEEEQVQRGESAEDAARHHQQQDVKLLLALLDFPGDTGRRECDDGAHQDQAHVDAVHADVVADAQAGHPGNLLLELVARDAGIELEEHLQCQQRRDKRGQNGHGAHHRPESARHQQQHDRCEERPADDVGESGHVAISGPGTGPAPRRGRTGRRRSANCPSGAGARRGRPTPWCRASRARRRRR